MLKKNNLALLTLIIVGLFSSLTTNIFAQKTDSSAPTPESKFDILQKYKDISALPSAFPMEKRREAFRNVSNEGKALLFKFHLAMQFIKNPNLTKDQRDLILESISAITADTYDRSKDQTNLMARTQTVEARARILFPKKDVIEIFSSLGGDSEDIKMLDINLQINSFKTKSERGNAYDKLSPIEKSNYWKVRFVNSLANESSLTSDQQQLVLDSILFNKKNLYESRKSSELKKVQTSLLPLIERLKDVFSPEKGTQIFSLFEDGGFEIESGGRCHCSTETWLSGCTLFSSCSESCSNPNPSNGTHCGFFGLWYCNGRCSSDN